MKGIFYCWKQQMKRAGKERLTFVEICGLSPVFSRSWPPSVNRNVWQPCSCIWMYLIFICLVIAFPLNGQELCEVKWKHAHVHPCTHTFTHQAALPHLGWVFAWWRKLLLFVLKYIAWSCLLQKQLSFRSGMMLLACSLVTSTLGFVVVVGFSPVFLCPQSVHQGSLSLVSSVGEQASRSFSVSEMQRNAAYLPCPLQGSQGGLVFS